MEETVRANITSNVRPTRQTLDYFSLTLPSLDPIFRPHGWIKEAGLRKTCGRVATCLWKKKRFLTTKQRRRELQAAGLYVERSMYM